MRAFEIIKAAIPNADDELCEYIMWTRTSYPFDTITPKVLFSAARRFKRASDNKIKLCELCDRIADFDNCVCAKCHTALSPRIEKDMLVI